MYQIECVRIKGFLGPYPVEILFEIVQSLSQAKPLRRCSRPLAGEVTRGAAVA